MHCVSPPRPIIFLLDFSSLRYARESKDGDFVLKNELLFRLTADCHYVLFDSTVSPFLLLVSCLSRSCLLSVLVDENGLEVFIRLKLLLDFNSHFPFRRALKVFRSSVLAFVLTRAIELRDLSTPRGDIG